MRAQPYTQSFQSTTGFLEKEIPLVPLSRFRRFSPSRAKKVEIQDSVTLGVQSLLRSHFSFPTDGSFTLREPLLSHLPTEMPRLLDKATLFSLVELETALREKLWICSTLLLVKVYEDAVNTYYQVFFGEDAVETSLIDRINAWRGLLSEELIQEMHRVRRFRNDLLHEASTPHKSDIQEMGFSTFASIFTLHGIVTGFTDCSQK